MKRKISDMMNEAYKDELLALQPVPCNADAITQKTLAKLGLGQETAHLPNTGPQRETSGIKSVPKRKAPRRALRIMAIAATLLVIMSSLVYAASVVYNMVRQNVSYFEPHTGLQTPVNGPTYHGTLAMDIEQYNAAVGLSVTDNGKTVTLDTIAVDDNFINAFFTIAYDEPIDLNAALDGPYPPYSKLRHITPWFTLQVDGKDIDGGFSTLDEYDPYMVDDSTVKMMVRWVVPTLLPNTFALSLHAEEYDAETGIPSPPVGTFHFDLSVDKSASAAVTRAAAPGQYEMGGRTLDLNKLAVTPFGTVLSVNGHWDGNDLNPDPAYLMPGNFYITDDKGHVLNSFWNNTVASGASVYAIELIGGSPDAESVTLTPIKPKDNWDDQETRTYSVADIGAKIEIDSLGGYYLEDYIIEGSRVSLVLRPYGQCNYVAGGIVIDDDHVSLANGRSGLVNEQIDRKTGLLTYSVDYYAATPEELRAITTFSVVYDGAFELDEAAAITLPLQPTAAQ